MKSLHMWKHKGLLSHAGKIFWVKFYFTWYISVSFTHKEDSHIDVHTHMHMWVSPQQRMGHWRPKTNFATIKSGVASGVDGGRLMRS